MTNEQIKQNAEQYALKKTLISTDSFHGMAESYLEGAHSRDEEIKRLENRLALFNDDLDKALYRKEKFRHKNQRAQQHIKYLKAKLDKPSNPWISVEERLPEKTRNLSPFPDEYDEKVVLVINKQGGKRLAYRDYKGVWRDDYNCEIVNQNYARITHWMPIPQLPKE